MKRLRVNKNRRCPVCGNVTWCLVAPDRSDAICMRVASERRVICDGADGYIHLLNGQAAAPRVPQFAPPSAAEINLNVEAILRRWSMDTTPHALAELGASLGITVESLRRLGAVVANRHNAWAFPMYAEQDGFWEPVGIRLRNMAGDKWAVTGSRQGLFMPTTQEMAAPVLICEGPTDTAAMLDLGFTVIGRASCTSGGDELRKLLAGKRRDIVICADTDSPGQRGAAQLALMLGNCKIITPTTGKDARAWKQAGATRPLIEAIIRNTKPASPESLRRLIQKHAPRPMGKPIGAPSPADGSLS